MLCFNALRPERKPSFAIPNRSRRTEDFDLFNMFQHVSTCFNMFQLFKDVQSILVFQGVFQGAWNPRIRMGAARDLNPDFHRLPQVVPPAFFFVQAGYSSMLGIKQQVHDEVRTSVTVLVCDLVAKVDAVRYFGSQVGGARALWNPSR